MGTRTDGSRKYYVMRGANRARFVRTYLTRRAELEEQGLCERSARWPWWDGRPEWAKPPLLPKIYDVARERAWEFRQRLERERKRAGVEEDLEKAAYDRMSERLGFRPWSGEAEEVPDRVSGEVDGIEVVLERWSDGEITVLWTVDGGRDEWHLDDGGGRDRLNAVFRPHLGEKRCNELFSEWTDRKGIRAG